ncbi:uncharacterized protein [Miscanthus floridulus]|uniref:uncharacterized protein n=1 Tax=Miscanthus floridulus TaxID=154761 RepID=UPI00345759DB
MRPDTGFVELPAGLGFWDSVTPLPEHAVVRAANYAMDEQRKKKKDDKRKKRRAKQQAKLQREKRRQGSSEEEEEEEEGDGSRSPIPWDDLAAGDEDPPSTQAGPFAWHLSGQEGGHTPRDGGSKPSRSVRAFRGTPGVDGRRPLRSVWAFYGGPEAIGIKPPRSVRAFHGAPGIGGDRPLHLV